MERTVIAELLDHLPPTHADARRSRRDLQRINRLMWNAALLRRTVGHCLPDTHHRPWRVLELGAGDGTLAARLWSRLPSPPAGSRLSLLDRLPVVEESSRGAVSARGWIPEVLVMDIREWIHQDTPASLDLVYANLFVHHFVREELSAVLTAIAARTRALVLLEPRRSVAAMLGARLLGCIGCNAVTRHDAVHSVAAGFRGTEITALWPESSGWILTESTAGPFGHCFTARRCPDA